MKQNKIKDKEIIKKSLAKSYPNLGESKQTQVAREIIFAPNERMVDLGDKKISVADLRYQVAREVEDNGYRFFEDAAYREAGSMEAIDSETSSIQEYFRWLGETSSILQKMNDGYVSSEDLEIRNDFLSMSHQRETELLVCLGLYQSSRSSLALEKIKEIRYKLQKLREMRSLIEMRTRNQSDVDIPRSEFEMAMPYYKYIKGLSQRPFGYDIPREQKMRMGIDFEDEDENFEDPDYSYHLLLNKVLDEMAEEESSEYQFSQDMSLELSSENFSENSDKIEENYRR